MSAVGNHQSVGRDRLLRATLTAPAVTADLVRQALQKQTTELAAVLSAPAFQRPRMLVVVERASTPSSICLSDPQGRDEAVAQERAQK
jgi:hypothetical protein